MKKNNKGFSLIELIIVIAIMAILVAIIAPNLTKYLGKSKKSTDKKNADEIASQIQTSISDFESQDSAADLISNIGSSLTVKWNANGIDTANSSTDPAAGSDDSFYTILGSNITSSTKAKETNGYAEATIKKVSGGKYEISVKVGNASVTK